MRWASRTSPCRPAPSGSGARCRAPEEDRTMRDFAYHRPESLQQAVSVRKSAADGAYLAGGMTLIPTLKQRLAQPSDLVDLAALKDLAGVRTEGGALVIGAMTRHAAVAASPD